MGERAGPIRQYYEKDAPEEVREAVRKAGKEPFLPEDFPYAERMSKKLYEKELYNLQIELMKVQRWAQAEGTRICVLFEGRDASGKGGSIKRFRENMNPRVARIVALPKPSDRERGQWYFQRYIQHLPSAGEIILFDRSWYNRGVVEHVFGFCTPPERARFFRQLPAFEEMILDEGIKFVKIWLNVSRPAQLQRFIAREEDPLKRWKLSRIDIEGLAKWDAYTDAIRETFHMSHRPSVPWNVVRSDDKRRARLETIRIVLRQIDYADKDPKVVGSLDPGIVIAPDDWHG